MTHKVHFTRIMGPPHREYMKDETVTIPCEGLRCDICSILGPGSNITIRPPGDNPLAKNYARIALTRPPGHEPMDVSDLVPPAPEKLKGNKPGRSYRKGGRCATCGAKNRPGFVKCPGCGARLG